MTKNKYAVALVLDKSEMENVIMQVRQDLKMVTCEAVSKEEALGKAMYELNREDTGKIKMWEVVGFEPNALMVEEITRLLIEDNLFIAAIKVYRTYNPTAGLKEGKAFVDEIRQRLWAEGKMR